MAKTNLYVKLEISPPSGYIIINDFFDKTDLEYFYNDTLESVKSFGSMNKYECLEGYELMHVLVNNVSYDGRKRKITNSDIHNALVNNGYAEKVGESIFGSFLLPTEKLTNLLDNQLNKRKQLIADGNYIEWGNVS